MKADASVGGVQDTTEESQTSQSDSEELEQINKNKLGKSQDNYDQNMFFSISKLMQLCEGKNTDQKIIKRDGGGKY